MTFYQQETARIKDNCYSNQWQIDAVIRTRHFIDKNFDKTLSLELLTHIAHTSKFHLLRLFRRYYGQTPQQYIIDKRLEKSKEYLLTGMMVAETCFSVGFECPSSFSTLFKRRNGLSPVEFQKRAILTK